MRPAGARPAGLAALLALAGCVAAGPGIVQAPPPAPAVRAEVVPPPPSPNFLWVPGHWAWRGGGRGYVWIPGRYLVPVRPGWAWMPGHWAPTAGGFVWLEGHWEPR